MRKFIFILAMIALWFGAQSAKAQTGEDNLDVICTLKDRAFKARCNGNYEKAENDLQQALLLFEVQPEEIRARYSLLKADIYYTLARYYALSKERTKSLKSLRKAVDLGWCNHGFLSIDNELKSIRHTKAFNAIAEDVRTRSMRLADNH